MGWHEHQVQPADSPQQSGPDKITKGPAENEEPQQRRADKGIPPSRRRQTLCARVPARDRARGPLMFKQKYWKKRQSQQQEFGNFRISQFLYSREDAVELRQHIVLHNASCHELPHAQPDCRVNYDLGHDEKRQTQQETAVSREVIQEWNSHLM